MFWFNIRMCSVIFARYLKFFMQLLWECFGTTLSLGMTRYFKNAAWLCVLAVVMATTTPLLSAQKEPASVKTNPQRLKLGSENDTINVRGMRVPVASLMVLEASGKTQEQPNLPPEIQTHAQSTQVSPKEGSCQIQTLAPLNRPASPSSGSSQKGP